MTLAICLHRPRKPGRWTPLVWILVPLGAGVVTGELIPCLCYRPHAIPQVMIPAACFAFSITCIGARGLRAIFAFGSLAMLLLLWFQHDALVWSGQCTSPTLARFSSRGYGQIELARVSSELKRVGETDRTEYPAAWLRDLPIEVALDPPPNQHAECAWHTWLTGLYLRRDTARDFWFPGGTLSEAADKLEIRERPSRDAPRQDTSNTGRQRESP